MVKGIVNAFDHMGFCLVRNLTDVQMASGLLYGHQILLPRMLVLPPTFTLGSNQLQKVQFLTLLLAEVYIYCISSFFKQIINF